MCLLLESILCGDKERMMGSIFHWVFKFFLCLHHFDIADPSSTCMPVS